MRIFKTRLFSKWARKTLLTDNVLRHAVQEMEAGLIDGDLGGRVYKKRVPLQGRGKRGGARTILAFQFSDKAFFVFGYSKNERANITSEELEMAREFAKEVFNYSDEELEDLLENGTLIEVRYDGQKFI